MTKNNIKAILVASLIIAMILPFSSMNMAEAFQNTEVNKKLKEKDRTKELKAKKFEDEKHFESIKLKMSKAMKLREDIEEISNTKKSLAKDIMSKLRENKNQLKQINMDLDREQKKEHQNDISKQQIEKMMEQQTNFEKKLFSNESLMKMITSVGIDIATKEIQIGLDENEVGESNKMFIIEEIDNIMPKDAKWHVVMSDKPTSFRCNQMECDPVIGGNAIVDSSGTFCSFGYSAARNGHAGFITAGHCYDGKTGSHVRDNSNDWLGIVGIEKFSFGTDCDCAWIWTNNKDIDNKVYLSSRYQPTISSIVSTYNQQNDYILKSGITSGVTYGKVTGINKTVWVGNYLAYGQVQSNTMMTFGDSGGTVVNYGTGTKLYGSVTAGDWWGNYHQPVDKVISSLKIKPVLG